MNEFQMFPGHIQKLTIWAEKISSFSEWSTATLRDISRSNLYSLAGLQFSKLYTPTRWSVLYSTEGIRTEFISLCCFICQPEWWNKKYFWLYEEKILWRQFCSISWMFISRWGQSQSLPVTPPLVRIINLENSFRAKFHHYHQIVIQSLHLSGQIAALFTRDGSGEPFHVL